MKSKRRILKLIVIVFCILLIKKIIDSPPPLTGSFYGTYAYKEYTICIMVDNGDFYLMNRLEDIYVKGKYDKKTESTYYLSGNCFQDQQITLKNRKFRFMFEGEEMQFEKTSNTPFTFEGLDELVLEYQLKKENI